jgi:hypothetical protein
MYHEGRVSPFAVRAEKLTRYQLGHGIELEVRRRELRVNGDLGKRERRTVGCE